MSIPHLPPSLVTCRDPGPPLLRRREEGKGCSSPRERLRPSQGAGLWDGEALLGEGWHSLQKGVGCGLLRGPGTEQTHRQSDGKYRELQAQTLIPQLEMGTSKNTELWFSQECSTAHTQTRMAPGLRVRVNKEDHLSNITIGFSLKMTSGTNILPVSKKFKLPVGPGNFCCFRQIFLPSCSDCWEEPKLGFPLSFGFHSPCHHPGATAGHGLVLAQCMVNRAKVAELSNMKCTASGW